MRRALRIGDMVRMTSGSPAFGWTHGVLAKGETGVILRINGGIISIASSNRDHNSDIEFSYDEDELEFVSGPEGEAEDCSDDSCQDCQSEEAVHSPSHYKITRDEVIDIIKDDLLHEDDPMMGAYKYAIIKYILRAPKKGLYKQDWMKAFKHFKYAEERLKELGEWE